MNSLACPFCGAGHEKPCTSGMCGLVQRLRVDRDRYKAALKEIVDGCVCMCQVGSKQCATERVRELLHESAESGRAKE